MSFSSSAVSVSEGNFLICFIISLICFCCALVGLTIPNPTLPLILLIKSDLSLNSAFSSNKVAASAAIGILVNLSTSVLHHKTMENLYQLLDEPVDASSSVFVNLKTEPNGKCYYPFFLREPFSLKNVDFWEPVFDDITQRCQLNHVPVDSWTIAMLVSHIKAWDQPDLTKTEYYTECQRNKLHDLNVEEKMNTSFVPMESSNPYIVKLR